MPNCVVKRCGNQSERNKKSDGITYHRIPHEPRRKEKWIKSLIKLGREENWYPSKTSLVCSIHFKNDEFITTKNGKRVILKPNAFPVFRNLEEKRLTESSLDTVSSSIVQKLQVVPKIELTVSRQQTITPIIDDEEVIITPSIYILRKKLEQKSDLAKKRLKALKCWRAKCKRLKEKCTNLQKLTDDLKKIIDAYQQQPKV